MTARRKLHFRQDAIRSPRPLPDPRRLGGVHVAIALDWREVAQVECTASASGNPAGFDLRCLAGLDVRVVHATHDASHVPAVVDASWKPEPSPWRL